MLHYVLSIIVFRIFLSGTRTVNGENYDDFICGHDWMYAQFDVEITGRSHLSWFRRCIEYENLDVNEQSVAHGATAIGSAVLQSDILAIKYLIGKGASLELREYIGGHTPLHEAVFYNMSGVVRLLLDVGANVNARTYSEKFPFDNGKTPLHISVRDHDLIISRILLANGADINAGDGELNTPLHLFLKENHWEVYPKEDELRHLLLTALCDLMIDSGANAYAKNEDKKTPRDLAKEYLNIKNPTKIQRDMEGCVEIVLSR